ncbi:YwaF family protein [Oceanobacillus manasiensis]|uniref:YwaF family protein n=1 Tax=Oceanobacillus manasiensis TaxID=586413 RepID=UPI0005AA7720|nr:TIGR02206 family membrane protein [Oceanobacillus manasiensis]
MYDAIFSVEGEPFVIFKISHLVMLSIYFVGFILIIYFNSLKRQPFYKRIYNIIRWSLFILLILSEISYQIWSASTGIWNLKEHIPLHLCGVASITAALTLLLQNKMLATLTFYIGLVPALIALITPDLLYNFPHFRFWKFFVHHIVISWASLFVIVTSSITLKYRSLLISYGLLLIYAAFIGFIVNPILDVNYLYLRNTPISNTPLNYFGDGVLYYVNLCLVALTVFSIQWAIVRYFQNRKDSAEPLL